MNFKMLKFAANLSMMFNEAGSLLEKYDTAASAGFRYVECQSPYSITTEQLAKKSKELRLEHVLINVPVGTAPGEDKGFACLPNARAKFRDSLQTAIEYAKVLNCKLIHIMAGLEPSNISRQELQDTYLENLRYASQQLENTDIIGLIEAINPITIPGYFLNSYEQAIKYLDTLPSNIRLQLDLFHLQMTQGCLTHNIRRFIPYTRHIQIAQVPDRHEPTSKGEINYAYVFDHLRSLNYDGYIGLEYIPADNTLKGLESLKEICTW